MQRIDMRFPQGRAKALTLSYDDGVEQDIRLIDIMNCHGLKGTFNLNSGLFAPEGTTYPAGQIHRRMSQKQCYEFYANSGQEVAIHGLNHPFLERLSQPAAMMEVIEDRRRLEEMFGGMIRGCAYPFGTYSDEVVEILRGAGIVYARTTKSTESFDIPTDWLRLPATCHHRTPNLKQLTKKFVEDTPARDPWLFYLWGHSYEFEGNDDWYIIEEFAKEIGGKQDIWYATNIEIFDYIAAWKQLRFDVACTCIQNPTATDLWLQANENSMCVKAGETVRL